MKKVYLYDKHLCYKCVINLFIQIEVCCLKKSKVTCGYVMMFLAFTKQDALEKDFSAYFLRNEKQLRRVCCGDSKAWKMKNKTHD
jgi:hypothetical protein